MSFNTGDLGKYSMGIGDRFAHQGKAQLSAFKKAEEQGVIISPVWNKSYREHSIIGSQASQTFEEAKQAVSQLNWNHPFFVDADHINLSNVDFFLQASNFYTLDVAEEIGKKASDKDIELFIQKHKSYIGDLTLPNIDDSFQVTEEMIRSIAEKYLYACQEAERIYQHIYSNIKIDNYVIEVSMDETDEPQTPLELFFILAALADLNIPVQTIAPKFSGAFYKGVEYVGDVDQFEKEFTQDVAVIKKAIHDFGLNPGLKLSVHSGSDKFKIYPIIHKVIKQYDAGLHLKTAGTTWLEEMIGLSESGDAGLQIAKSVYINCLDRAEELIGPYRTVLDVDENNLPSKEDVESWDGQQFSRALTHEQSDELYNSDFRQFVHVGYKIAAEVGDDFLKALEINAHVIAEKVSNNIFQRHMCPLFLGK